MTCVKSQSEAFPMYAAGILAFDMWHVSNVWLLLMRENSRDSTARTDLTAAISCNMLRFQRY